MPVLPHFPAPEIRTLSEADGRGTPALSEFTACTHVGTHLDAPAHFIPGGKQLDDYGLERFMVEAVVWDVRQPNARPITTKDLQGARPACRPGDAVLLYTGWEHHWDSPAYLEHPHVERSAAEWLVEREIGILGVDLLTPDMPTKSRPADYDFPAHFVLLGAEVLIVENLTRLAGLCGQRIELHALPLKLECPDGAPTRAVAVAAGRYG